MRPSVLIVSPDCGKCVLDLCKGSRAPVAPASQTAPARIVTSPTKMLAQKSAARLTRSTCKFRTVNACVAARKLVKVRQ
jgi:hypothetical protein